MITSAIVGGTGYTGKYILEFCNKHPNISEFEIFANKNAQKTIHEIFPGLVGEVENKTIKSISDLDLSYDVYFFALPHGESLKTIPHICNANKKVIDLGADFRLDSKETFINTYQLEHPAPLYLKEKNYGLAELNNTYNYNLIANPGCYPTAALLSIIPFIKNYSNNILSISTVAYSGLSGAGKKISKDLLFSENYNNVKAYNIGTHRHEVEIAQEINKFSCDINYSLTTHLLPVYSGIYSTTIIDIAENIPQNAVSDYYKNQYKNAAFVRLRNNPPELKWVIGTNYCDLNIMSVNKKIIITAAIDNLIKGASGQAIQNMNKLFGWKESLGLKNLREEFQNV